MQAITRCWTLSVHAIVHVYSLRLYSGELLRSALSTVDVESYEQIVWEAVATRLLVSELYEPQGTGISTIARTQGHYQVFGGSNENRMKW